MNEIKSINNMPLHDTVARSSIAELEDKVNNIEDNIDLSDYALKSQVPTKTSQLTNNSGFLTSIPSQYITESELTAKNYITEDEVNELLENVNTENLTHVFLTKEEYNALTNEEKNDESKLYIITDAEEVDISSYATKAYVDEAIENIDVGDIDLSGYALKTEIPTKVSQLTNDSNYATTSYIDNLIGDVGALLDILNGEVI